jgi:hypothetical protein
MAAILKTYKATIRYANGQQAETYFDHVPPLGCVVRVQGSDAYATVLSVEQVQKSWHDILGYDPANVFVDGQDIVRCVGENQYKVLWHFNRHHEARDVLAQWLADLEKLDREIAERPGHAL